MRITMLNDWIMVGLEKHKGGLIMGNSDNRGIVLNTPYTDEKDIGKIVYFGKDFDTIEFEGNEVFVMRKDNIHLMLEKE